MNTKKSNMNFGLRGWIVILYCILTYFIVTASKDALLNMAASSLAEEFGWNYTTMVSLNTVFGWVTVIFILFGGQAMRKFSPKWMAVIYGVIYTIALLALPKTTQFWMYVVILFLVTMINITWAQQLNNTITANWFPQKRGIVMGLTTIGLPLGSGLGPKMYALLMNQAHLSFSAVYGIFAAISAVAVIVAVLFIKDYPEQCGCYPDNDRSSSTEKVQAMMAETQKKVDESIWNAKLMLTTRETWLVILTCGFLQLFSNGSMSQMIPRLMASGYNPDQATNMMLVPAITACFGSAFIGWLDQMIGPKKATIVTHLLAVISCVLNIIPSTITVLIAIGFTGVTLGGSANFMVSLISKMWGRYSFSRAYPIIHAMAQIIGCCGVLVFAQVSNLAGYNWVYIVIATLSTIGIIATAFINMNAIEEKELRISGVRREG